MAYDYWAAYEKHLNAMRHAHEVFLRDYNTLGAREQQVQQARASGNMISAQNALSEFGRYTAAVTKEGRDVQNLGRIAMGKLNSYVRNVKRFPESSQHLQNIQGVVDGVEANLRHLQSRARAVRGF